MCLRLTTTVGGHVSEMQSSFLPMDDAQLYISGLRRSEPLLLLFDFPCHAMLFYRGTMLSNLGGAGDRLGEYLCKQCTNLPFISGRFHCTNT